MLLLYSHHSRLATSFHIKIHYHFIFNHLTFANLFVQTVRFSMWVKLQGTSSPESMNNCKKCNIFKHLQESHMCNSDGNKDCFSVINQAVTEYQLKRKEAMHIKWIQPKLNKQVKHYKYV